MALRPVRKAIAHLRRSAARPSMTLTSGVVPRKALANRIITTEYAATAPVPLQFA